MTNDLLIAARATAAGAAVLAMANSGEPGRIATLQIENWLA